MPMNSATNGVAGAVYISDGVPICSITPPYMTATWSRDGERLFLVVRDVERRDAKLELDAPDLLAQLHPHLRVERRERLVEEEHSGLDRERAGERHPLLHPTRELMRVASRCVPRPTSSSSSSTRGPRSFLCLPRIFNPNSTFWRAVMFGNNEYAWKTIPMSRLLGATFVTSLPSTTMRPWFGRSKPATRRSAVVLPQPDGPSSDRNSPSPSDDVDAVQRLHRAEVAVQVLELEVSHLATRHNPGAAAACARPLRAARASPPR